MRIGLIDVVGGAEMMPDREKMIQALENADVLSGIIKMTVEVRDILVSMLKEQEKKQITLHKKHVITWKRDEKFTMRELYEAICETLLDEGELFTARTDDHEKVEFVFYVAEGLCSE